MYGADSIDGLPNNVHYLCNNSIEIGNVTFFGIPFFMEDIMDGSFHLFGHQHEANAMIAYNGIIFSNAAVLDNHYNLIANSRVIEL